MKNLSIKNILVTVSVIVVTLLSINILISFIQLKNINEAITKKEKEILPQTMKFLELEKNVIQVQQWLTDISATRAAPGYDDGFTEAQKYFENGNKAIDFLIDNSRKFGDLEMVNKLEDFKANFASYYEVGKKMANAYISGGSEAGNKIMEELDSYASKQSDTLNGWIEEHKKENLQETEDILSSLDTNITISIITGLIIILLSIISFILLYTKVTNSLNNFKDGLMSFFKYLNKESNNVTLLDDNVKDEFGEMNIVVNQNIQKTKRLLDQDKALIDNVKVIVDNINNGLLDKRIEARTENESLNELKNMFNEMLNTLNQKICEDINKLELALKKYQELDFTFRIENTNGKTSQGLNSLANIINDMLVENKANGLTLEKSAKILLSNVNTLQTASNEAASSLEETAAALEQITSNISNNTNNVVEMSNLASKVTASAYKGEELANQTTISMDEINEQVTHINEAISVIDQIAFQTNILSLNAAVEAATAGEAGKGFAVVAGEVRNLATKSAEAANDIKNLVESATGKANIGKKIADDMIHGYKDLNENISKTIDLIKNVEGASKEQLSGIRQINDAVSVLDRQTQQNAKVANDTRDIAVKTQNIAQTVVTNANNKNFIGKDSVRAKD